MRPIATIEGKGFKELLSTLEPAYEVPCQKTVTQLLKFKGDDLRTEIMTKVPGQDSISFTADYWTSAATDSYLGVTGHYIDAEWNKQHHYLQVEKMSLDHTHSNIAVGLDTVRQGYNIPCDSIAVTTTDNAAKHLEGCTRGSQMAARSLCCPHPAACSSGRPADSSSVQCCYTLKTYRDTFPQKL